MATALCAAPRLPWLLAAPVLCWAELLAPRDWGEGWQPGVCGARLPPVGSRQPATTLGEPGMFKTTEL